LILADVEGEFMYDLIVVGAGPAGSSAARMAGRAGLKTLIIEKEIFPREKPCGGAISEHGTKYLDFEIPDRLSEREFFGIQVKYKNIEIKKIWNERLAVMVKRAAFDNFLLEKAEETGVTVQVGENVKDFRENSDFITVYTDKAEYKSKFLIIAEGAHGKLHRHIRKMDDRSVTAISLVVRVPELSKKQRIEEKSVGEFHFDVAKGGYGWIFPAKDHYNIGIGGVVDDLRCLKDVMRKFVDKNGGKFSGKPAAHMIPFGGIKRKIVSSRVLLTGDSAGFTDPFTGEGIAFAIRSGQLEIDTLKEEMKSRIKKLSKQLKSIKASKTKISEDRDQLSKKFIDAMKIIDELEAKITSLGADVSDLTEKKSKLAEERTKLQSELEELRKMKEAAEKRNQEYGNLMNKLKKMIDAGALTVKIRKGRMIVSLSSDILFASGSARLTEDGEAAIVELSETLKELTDRSFLVVGHSDATPIRTKRFPSNWELSSQRAIEVVKLMIEAGVNPEMLSAAGNAEYFGKRAANHFRKFLYDFPKNATSIYFSTTSSLFMTILKSISGNL